MIRRALPMNGEVLPDAHRVRYVLHIKRVMMRDISFGLADGEVWVDGRQIYTAENLRTGLIPLASSGGRV